MRLARPTLALALGWVACVPAPAPVVEAPVLEGVVVGAAPSWRMPEILPVVVGVLVDPRFTDDEALDIRAAERSWERATGGCVRFVPGDDVEILRIDSPAELPPGEPEGTVAVWDSVHARLWFEPSAVCTRPPVCSIARQVVAVHELGHVLGLGHSDEPGTCMRAIASWSCGAEHVVPWVDAWAFCAAHGGCACAHED